MSLLTLVADQQDDVKISTTWGLLTGLPWRWHGPGRDGPASAQIILWNWENERWTSAHRFDGNDAQFSKRGGAY
jgi:hypothetical protein